MRLRQVGLRNVNNDVCNMVRGTAVWLPYGWYARLLLADVTGREFDAVDRLLSRSGTMRFAEGYEKYNYRAEEARVEVCDWNFTREFVQRGALLDKNVMYEMGAILFQQLEDGIRSR